MIGNGHRASPPYWLPYAVAAVKADSGKGTNVNLLSMKGISKAFGGAKALTDVSLEVEKGEIHALLGENGAGKSTLMNVLTGVVPRDEGTIHFNGIHCQTPTIPGMEKAGIAFVHQELSVVNDLRVFENVFLNREKLTRFGLLDHKAMIRETEALFRSLGIRMDPRAMVSFLRTGEKQQLEICRALQMDARLIILDEPTTALSQEEAAHLFAILRRMKARGVTFLFISHKMPEIFAIADRYTVLRNGRNVASGPMADTTPAAITRLMVGDSYADRQGYEQRPLGEVVLEAKGLSAPGFRHLSLQIRQGEIVALTGLQGCGAGEVIQTLFGALPPTDGTITLRGKPLRGGITAFMKQGIGMLPSNRKENSVVPDMTILENLTLAEHSLSSKKPFIRRKTEEATWETYRDMLSIRAGDPGNPVGSLSRGNQQKVFLARWLHTGAEVLLLDNPTQGVDVGAKAEIYRLILSLARQGKTILINTLEIPEMKQVADRCLVFFDGEVVRELSWEEIDEATVMLYSTNAHRAEDAPA